MNLDGVITVDLEIRTKSSFAQFVRTTAQWEPEDGELQDKLRELRNMYEDIRSLNGRSDTCRQTCREAEKVRKQLLRLLNNEEQMQTEKNTTKNTKKTSPAPEVKQGPKSAKAAKEPKEKKERPVRKPKFEDKPADGTHKLCLCGCGQATTVRETKGGQPRTKLFLPGHDAKLKSKVLEVSRNRLGAHVLSKYAVQFLARWSAVSDEVKTAAGITPEPSWESNPSFGHAPRTWEQFDEYMTVARNEAVAQAE